ncbi:MAG: hypothetical protein IKR50_11585 [Prevotella sp.]|nr:hypothetical protein [Prevotella sp.]
MDAMRSQMPRRGETAVASRFNGRDTAGIWGMRAVGTLPTPCQMPMATAAQKLE